MPRIDHAELLGVLAESQDLGLLGPGPIERQYDHAVRLAAAIGNFAGRFVDLGAGGGLPGLVLAELWPQALGTLLDAQHRRCAFLERALTRLGLAGRFEVECGRAERLARDPRLRGQFELVVARSFGPPSVTAECAVGFLRRGGALVVTEPPDRDMTSGRWPPAGLAELGFDAGVAIGHGGTSAFRALLEHEVEERWPRREGIPRKRPLW